MLLVHHMPVFTETLSTQQGAFGGVWPRFHCWWWGLLYPEWWSW